MTAQSELHTLAVKVGEISGQLRELIHNQNNMAMKLDGLTEKLLTAPSQADYEKLSNRVEALGARVDALEAAKDRNDGERGFLAAVLGSRAFGVVITALFSAYIAVKEGLFK